MFFTSNMFLTSMLDHKCLAAENIGDDATLYVGGTGPGNYTSIQDAIDDAESGDKIFLYNKIYYENIIIKKSINIIGENKYSTIIDGSKQETVLNLTAEWVNISNMMIKNSSVGGFNQSYAGFNIKNSNHIFIRNMVISECELPVNIGNSNNISMQHCTIFDNIGGVNIYNSSNNTITYCNISTSITDGISFYRSSYNLVSNCNISNSGSGISLRVSSNNTITNNAFYNNSVYGINIVTVRTTNNLISERDIIFNNNFINNLIDAHDGYNNSWDDGSHGNYWDDYSGVDSDDDGVGDTPYIFYGNTDIYPLINPVQLDFNEPETSVLYLAILSPKDNTIVKGLVDIKGTAYGTDEILGVKIKINDGSWQQAIGTTNWHFEWNTTQLENDVYTISTLLNSTDGDYTVKSIKVQVNNIVEGKKENGNADNIPGFELFLLLVAFFIVFIIIKFKK